MEYFGREDLLEAGIPKDLIGKMLAYCNTSGYVKRKTIRKKNTYRTFTVYCTLDFKKSLEIKLKESPNSRFANIWKKYLKLIPTILKAKGNDYG